MKSWLFVMQPGWLETHAAETIRKTSKIIKTWWGHELSLRNASQKISHEVYLSELLPLHLSKDFNTRAQGFAVALNVSLSRLQRQNFPLTSMRQKRMEFLNHIPFLIRLTATMFTFLNHNQSHSILLPARTAITAVRLAGDPAYHEIADIFAQHNKQKNVVSIQIS